MARSDEDIEKQLEELAKRLAALSPAEQARALKVIHAFGGTERSPDVMGGHACVVHTRIPVWLLESYRRVGWDEARILENFPTLSAFDLENAWAYRDLHGDEIEQAISDEQGNA
jgi:uncharacterized protein (DUF433 family)